MFKRKNLVTFSITDDMLFDNPQLHPQPVSKYIPDWLKKIPSELKMDSPPHGIEGLGTVKTIRTCPSFVDIFKEGYVILAPNDIYLTYKHDTGEWSFVTATVLNNLSDNNVQVQEHLDKQMKDYLPESANIHKVFKLQLPLTVNTPPGVNMRQIPLLYDFNPDWYVAYGAYKADLIPEINLQLFYTSDKEEVLIKQGTPLCILAPYRREKFNYKVEKFGTNKKLVTKNNKYFMNARGKFTNFYYKSGYHKV